MKGYLVLLRLLLYILEVERVAAVSVQFYRNSNFTDLSYESASLATCQNLPDDKKDVKINSIKTDICIMVYFNSNCQSYGRKYDLNNSLGWNWRIRSFHVCNEDMGGPQLNIDITQFYDLGKPAEVPSVLEKYRNVCTCINIPKYVQNLTKWSINNYGNELLVYYEQDCMEDNWKAKLITAGHFTNGSADVYDSTLVDTVTNVRQKPKSIGPDPSSAYFRKNCIAYLSQWIMKLEFLENSIHRNESKSAFSTSSLQKNYTNLIFFGSPNFRGAHFEAKSTDQCQNIPKRNNIRGNAVAMGSVKTDNCVLLYLENDCNGRSIKIYPDGTKNLSKIWETTVTGSKTLIALYNKFPQWRWITGSFRNCNDNEGGLQLNVYLTNYYPDLSRPSNLIVHEAYKNVCLCINIPYEVQLMDKWSMDNHGNSMMTYFEYNCSSSPIAPLWIPAGHSSFSMGIGSFKSIDSATNITQKIQSFGPDPNSIYFKTNCVKHQPSFPMSMENTTGVSIDESVSETLVAQNSTLQVIQQQQSVPDVLQLLLTGFQNLTTRVSQLERTMDCSQKKLDEVLEKYKDQIKELTYKLESSF